MKLRKSDILWKVVMEEVFDDLLSFIFPDSDQVYDMDRGFRFLEKELVELYPEPDKESNTRFADKVVEVFNREGQGECVFCHFEIQGETKMEDRPLFAKRMFRYFYRILDRYRKPVSAIAIFTGPDAGKMPDRFHYEYRKTRLLYEYHTVSILDFTDQELEESDNPFALVLLAARTSLLEGKIPELELLDRKLSIATKLLKKGIPQKKIRTIFVFLENYVLFEEPEMNRNFIERIKSQDKNNIMGIDEFLKQMGKEEGLAEGLEKGIEQGFEQGRENSCRLFVENLLKNSDFPEEKIASLANVTIDFVNDVKKTA
jgi:predicted transposase YdaD